MSSLCKNKYTVYSPVAIRIPLGPPKSPYRSHWERYRFSVEFALESLLYLSFEIIYVVKHDLRCALDMFFSLTSSAT
jgi:hypothetical protein